jgi:SAM-dependent methyltransferase
MVKNQENRENVGIDENTFVTLIGNTKNEIDKIMDKIKTGNELEFIFFSNKNDYMNKEKYMYFAKYMSNSEYNVEKSTEALDLNVSLNKNETFRITIKNNHNNNENNNDNDNNDNNDNNANNDNANENNLTEVYNNLIERVNNYSTLKMALYLARKSGDRNKFEIIIKKKSDDNKFDIDEFNIRCKLSDEIDLFDNVMKGKNLDNYPLIKNLLEDSNKIPIKERKEINKKIVFRFKERLTLIFDKTKDYIVKLDLTFVRFSKNLKRINNEIPNYELELEIQSNKMTSMLKKQIYDRLESTVELIQKSNFIVSKSIQEKVINYYKQLLIGNTNAKITSLLGRKPVSLEVQHVSSILPDKYAVTDKADGDRAMLIIYDAQVYLIGNNLSLIDTGIVLNTALASKYNGTIADGEYIYCYEYDRHIFMIFDCLFFGEKDIRNESSIIKRLSNIDKVIDECFINKKDKGFNFSYTIPKMTTFDLTKVTDFHKNEIKRYYKNIIDDINNWSIYPLIRRKYFIPVVGAMKWEIFTYSLAFWKLYTEDSDVKFPYHLDGLIYHPLEQIYTIDKQKSKYEEYKWKPPSHNSIDFYIEFKKDPLTRQDLIIYDNTNKIKNKPYKICNLYVGKTFGNQETPTPFKPFDKYDSVAYLFLKGNDKEVRDQDGEIIIGGTVVEFSYNNDPSISPMQRWVPMRTRHDKTTVVERYNRGYGNYITVAEKVWRSMINPVKMSDFKDLSIGGSKYHDKIQKLNMTISKDTIIAFAKEKVYYSSKKIAISLRKWHNWAKSNIMYTHCHHMYKSGKPQTILDFACGVGGDIPKHYYSEIEYCVGLEFNLNNLINPVNSANSRYNNLRRGKPNFPPMYFINADLRAELTIDEQIQALGGMTTDNEKLFRRFFDKTNPTMFDVINCQFAIHYFFESNESWNNFKKNVKNHLKNGGIFIVTTFDGDTIRKVLHGKEKFTEYYTTDKGEKKILFDVVKYYDDDVESGMGNKIDFHGAWMFNEGQYESEYLVDKQFLIDELQKDCDLKLIDYDLFENHYNFNKDYLTQYAKFQSNVKTRNTLLDVAEYYDDSEINITLRKFTNLFAYYVFRKKSTKQKGGKQKYDLMDDTQFGLLKAKAKSKSESESKSETNSSDKTFIKGINKILKTNKIIPKIGYNTMCKDLGIKPFSDNEINDNRIKKLAKKLVIDHDEPDKTTNILNGLNLIMVTPDCNNHYDIKYTKLNDVNKFGVFIMDGDKYYPVYQKSENISIFDKNNDVVKYLLANGYTI